MQEKRIFSVRDDKTVWAELEYAPETKEFCLRIPRDIDLESAPITISAYAGAGIFELNPGYSRQWVTERLIHWTRANIKDIYQGFGMEKYDELEMLLKLRGRCSQDDLYIEEIV